jgi:TonB family protein
LRLSRLRPGKLAFNSKEPLIKSSTGATVSGVKIHTLTRIACIIVVLAAATVLRAASEKPGVITRPNASLPASGMQAFGPSSEFDLPPKFISGAAPIYPITRLRLEEPGFAVITFVVDETGRTRDFRVEKTNYPFFGTHAIAAIQKWRFQPATKHGRPVSCRLRIPFNYRI